MNEGDLSESSQAGRLGELPSKRRSVLLPRRDWIFFFWLALILFSSTGVASEWAHGFYGYLFGGDSSQAVGLPRHLAQKAYHIFLFVVLGWLVAAPRIPAGARLRRGVGWAFVIGALSELVQLGFAGRNPMLSDVLLNGLSGSLSAWLRVRLE